MDQGGLEVIDARFEPDEAHLERLKKRRDGAAWSAVAGIFLLFAASSITALLIGSVLMVTYGTIGYLWWSRKITKLDDPWDDPEVDAWEAEFYDSGAGEEVETPADSPDSAWGGGPRF